MEGVVRGQFGGGGGNSADCHNILRAQFLTNVPTVFWEGTGAAFLQQQSCTRTWNQPNHSKINITAIYTSVLCGQTTAAIRPNTSTGFER